MRAFAYTSPEDYGSAAKVLRDSPTALPKAGGTDLLDLLKERILEPPRLVNLLRVAPVKGGPDTLGAGLTLAQVANSRHVQRHYPALATAANEAANPQIRNMGTVGGNLCQVSRCAYLRTGHACLKLGDDVCSADQPGAHTRYAGVFPHGGCRSAHASNLAPALIACGGRVVLTSPEGQREIEVEKLYQLPQRGVLADTVLKQDELIHSIALAPSALTRNSVYLELRERQTFDFALVAVSAALELADGKVKAARIACSGVAPIPLRAHAAEKVLVGKEPSDALLANAARAATKGAEPTVDNRHKVVLLERLIVRALKQLRGEK